VKGESEMALGSQFTHKIEVGMWLCAKTKMISTSTRHQLIFDNHKMH
jgi:hypothetical protein